MVGSAGQLLKAKWELISDKWPTEAEVGDTPSLPTKENIPCIKPLPYYSNFLALLKAQHQHLLTHRMESDIAN